MGNSLASSCPRPPPKCLLFKCSFFWAQEEGEEGLMIMSFNSFQPPGEINSGHCLRVGHNTRSSNSSSSSVYVTDNTSSINLRPRNTQTINHLSSARPAKSSRPWSPFMYFVCCCIITVAWKRTGSLWGSGGDGSAP